MYMDEVAECHSLNFDDASERMYRISCHAGVVF